MSGNGQDLPLKKLLPFIVCFLLMGTVPFVVAWAIAPEEKVFAGGLINVDDVSVYLSAIRQGAEGKWLFHYSFSPEQLSPRITYPFYLLIGCLMKLLGGSSITWFNIFKVISVIFSLLAVRFWVKRIFPNERRVQFTAWLLIAFGSGFGWFLAPIFSVDSPLFPDINFPDWTLLNSFFSAPHMIFSFGLIAIYMGILSVVDQTEFRWKNYFAGAVVGIAIGSFHSFLVGPIGLIAGIFTLITSVRNRHNLRGIWARAIVMIAPLIPFLYYFGVVSRRESLWEQLLFQNNTIPPPPPLGVFLGFGLLAIFALIGVGSWMKRGRNLLVPVWAGVNFLILYLPFPFSGRFALGFIIPVATLAAYGLEKVVFPLVKTSTFYRKVARITQTPVDTLRRVLIILTIPSSILVVMWTIQNVILTEDFPLYYHIDEIEAAEWLADHTNEDDLVFAYYPMGNYLPRLITGKVFLGHLFLTVNLDEKLTLVEKFWDSNTPNSWREGIILEWGVTYIYQGHYENAFNPGSIALTWEIVFKNDQVTIYTTR